MGEASRLPHEVSSVYAFVAGAGVFKMRRRLAFHDSYIFESLSICVREVQYALIVRRKEIKIKIRSIFPSFMEK